MKKISSYKLFSYFISLENDFTENDFEQFESQVKDVDIKLTHIIYYILDSLDKFCQINKIDYCNTNNERFKHIGFNYLLFLQKTLEYCLKDGARKDHLDEFKKFFIRIIEVAFVVYDEEFKFCKSLFNENKDFFEVIFNDNLIEHDESFASNVLLYKGAHGQPEIRLWNNYDKAYQTTSAMPKIGKKMDMISKVDIQKSLRNLSKFLLVKENTKRPIKLVYRGIVENKKDRTGHGGAVNLDLEELDSFKGKLSEKISSSTRYIKADNDLYEKAKEEQILDMTCSSKLSLHSNESRVKDLQKKYNKFINQNNQINSSQLKIIKKDPFKQAKIESLTSFSIAKQNHKVASSYNIPPYQLLKEFIKYAYSLDYKQQDAEIVIGEPDKVMKKKKIEQIPLELHLITLSILLGIHVTHVLSIMLNNEDTNDIYLNNKNQLKIKLTTQYGTVKDIRSNIFQDKKKHILIDLPKYMINIFNHIRPALKNRFKDSDEIKIDFITDFLKVLQKNFDYTISISIHYLHLYSFYYWNEIKQGSNLSHLFLMKKSDNIHNQLTYFTTNTKLINYSLWVVELANILSYDKYIEDYKTFNSFTHSSDWSGSNKFVEGIEVKTFLSSLSKIQFDSIEDNFNIKMVLIRYILSILIATRSYNQSCSLFSFLKIERKLFIQEKAKSHNIGKRIIPLNNLAFQTILYFYKLKEKYSLNYFMPILIIDTEPVELKNTSLLKWIEDKQNFLISKYGKSFFNEIKSFIFINDFDFGRHIFESYAHNKFRLRQEYIDAFLNHYEEGTEDQAKYNNFNNEIYTVQILQVIDKIQEDYLPDYTSILNEIKSIYEI